MKCSFCGKDIPHGTGKIFVRSDAKVLYFHVKKCESNALKLKRDARKLKWTSYYEKGSVRKKKTKK
ncbi:MAG: 50S ribosomal protein L24e [Nanoarchaeota archaeon]|nr:50S ribosomal protein L24e [Nanoarchaeota archaeon]MBU0962307.1 50S ribosomal protein L24e [Nanoarchaeota archaeon]